MQDGRECGNVIAKFIWQIENQRFMRTCQLKLAVTVHSRPPCMASSYKFTQVSVLK